MHRFRLMLLLFGCAAIAAFAVVHQKPDVEALSATKPIAVALPTVTTTTAATTTTSTSLAPTTTTTEPPPPTTVKKVAPTTEPPVEVVDDPTPVVTPQDDPNRCYCAADWQATGEVNGMPCGGLLPPCYVLQRESKGDPAVWNGGCYAPEGYAGTYSPCGGSNASGLWQFMRGTWAHHGGYLNAADAPWWVQNDRAAEVWNYGHGCGNWAAC